MMMTAPQYSLYTTAVVVDGGKEDVVDMLEGIASTPATQIESTASETLIAWTDPAFPAFVEVNEKKKWTGFLFELDFGIKLKKSNRCRFYHAASEILKLLIFFVSNFPTSVAGNWSLALSAP